MTFLRMMKSLTLEVIITFLTYHYLVETATGNPVNIEIVN